MTARGKSRTDCLQLAGVFLAAALLLATPSATHPGGLDANGCHYDGATGEYHCHQEVAPNPDAGAKAKKSRDNVCHDAASPNYTSLKYFISYRSMKACLESGGRAVHK